MIYLKNAIKITGIFILGLFVIIFLYPFLHESGHFIAVLLSGAKLKAFHIFPVPYIACDLLSTTVLEQNLIGIFGMLFPFAISFVYTFKNYWLWLISFYIKGISAIAFFISYLAILFYENGVVWMEEDVIKVLELTGQNSSVLLVVILMLLCVSIAALYNNKPFLKTLEFLKIHNK